MTVNVDFERWVMLSMVEKVRTLFPTTLVQSPGHRRPADPATEEWVAVTLLNSLRVASRKDWWVGSFPWQITHFSRLGEMRSDKDTMRPYAMAGVSREGLEGVSVDIYNYEDANYVWKTCMKMGKAEMQYVDEPALGAQSGVGVPASPSHIHAVAMTIIGVAATDRT